MHKQQNAKSIGARKALGSKIKAAKPTTVVTINEISEEGWKRIAFEANILDGVIAAPRSRKSAALAGTVLGWSTSKVYSRLKAYRRAGQALILAQNRSARDWRSHLMPEQNTIIETQLKSFLKTKRGQAISVFVDDTIAAFKVAKIVAPSAKSIRRRFERLPDRVKYAHKYSARAAADRFNLERGSTPPTHFPLERVQIDHTAADVWLLSDDYTLSLGRPTVTLVIDEFSRIVIGIHVTFGHPSVEELAEAMAIACLPKDGWLRAMGIKGVDWPWHGVMASIFVDRGVDFTSTAFHRGCQKWRIALSHRSQPHHGGIVERAIGTAMGETRNLPGNTRFSKVRRHEDRVDPAKTAKLVLKEYLAKLVQYFVVEYPHRIHPALGMTPAEKWNLGVHEYGEPRRAEDPHAFYLDFLHGHHRKLEKYGVMLSYLKYRNSTLQPLLNHAKAIGVLVKRDPADVSRAFLEDPRGGGYIELSNEVTQGKGITVAEWEKARKELKANLNGQQVTATGILGFVLKDRKGTARPHTPHQQESKLNRTKRRNQEHNTHRRDRSQARLPKAAPNPPIVVTRPIIDPASIPFFPTSGDAR